MVPLLMARGRGSVDGVVDCVVAGAVDSGLEAMEVREVRDSGEDIAGIVSVEGALVIRRCRRIVWKVLLRSRRRQEERKLI